MNYLEQTMKFGIIIWLYLLLAVIKLAAIMILFNHTILDQNAKAIRIPFYFKWIPMGMMQ